MTKFVSKGWGHELWMVNNDLYCGKKLFFAKGKRCSWHYHKIKTETFYCQYGKVAIFYSYQDCLENNKLLTKLSFYDNPKIYAPYTTELLKWLQPSVDGAEVVILCPGDTLDVPVNLKHSVYALEDSELIEISTMHSDEDSIRLISGD